MVPFLIPLCSFPTEAGHGWAVLRGFPGSWGPFAIAWSQRLPLPIWPPCPLPEKSSWARTATPTNQETPPSPVLSSHHDSGRHIQGSPGSPDEAIPARLWGFLLYKLEWLKIRRLGAGPEQEGCGAQSCGVLPMVMP